MTPARSAILATFCGSEMLRWVAAERASRPNGQAQAMAERLFVEADELDAETDCLVEEWS